MITTQQVEALLDFIENYHPVNMIDKVRYADRIHETLVSMHFHLHELHRVLSEISSYKTPYGGVRVELLIPGYCHFTGAGGCACSGFCQRIQVIPKPMNDEIHSRS